MSNNHTCIQVFHTNSKFDIESMFMLRVHHIFCTRNWHNLFHSLGACIQWCSHNKSTDFVLDSGSGNKKDYRSLKIHDSAWQGTSKHKEKP
jgi:hypothetical protein